MMELWEGIVRTAGSNVRSAEEAIVRAAGAINGSCWGGHCGSCWGGSCERR